MQTSSASSKSTDISGTNECELLAEMNRPGFAGCRFIQVVRPRPARRAWRVLFLSFGGRLCQLSSISPLLLRVSGASRPP